jgi:Mn-containing catalase
MGHVEQITNTINMLLDGASNPSSQPDDIPLSVALDSPNIHHFTSPATGRLQKCRLYEMSSNKAFRATVSYLIVRDLVHEKVFAKALETLGVNWGKALPVPRINTDNMPEVKDLENKNLHNVMWTFANDREPNGMAQIFKGDSPFDDGGTLEVIEGLPEGTEIPVFPESPQEFSPGLDTELKRMAQQIQTA